MTLHNDKESFRLLTEDVRDRTGIRPDISEKDYYVSLILLELSKKQNQLPAYFKGGTALYKAMKTLNRFSEDIDITVDIKNCPSSNQKKVFLEQATKQYTSLPRIQDKTKEMNQKGAITTIYEYDTMFSEEYLVQEDSLQRFGFVKVEGTSFTLSEPIMSAVIEPILYTKATVEQKTLLRETFNVKPFEIKVIKQERIFSDKIFATEYYYRRESFFDVCKHIYYLTVLFTLPQIQTLVNNPSDLGKMLDFVRKEDKNRLGSNLSEVTFSEFKSFTRLRNHDSFEKIFHQMQNTYVFQAEDKLELKDVLETMDSLYDILLTSN